MGPADPEPTAGGGAQQADIAPAEKYGAAVGARGAGDQVEKRRLSCAIGADDAHGLPRPNLERHILENLQSAKSFPDATRRQ